MAGYQPTEWRQELRLHLFGRLLGAHGSHWRGHPRQPLHCAVNAVDVDVLSSEDSGITYHLCSRLRGEGGELDNLKSLI